VDSRASLDAVERRKICACAGNRTLIRRLPSPKPTYCSDRAFLLQILNLSPKEPFVTDQEKCSLLWKPNVQYGVYENPSLTLFRVSPHPSPPKSILMLSFSYFFVCELISSLEVFRLKCCMHFSYLPIHTRNPAHLIFVVKSS
jgi:hypothetical protein